LGVILYYRAKLNKKFKKIGDILLEEKNKITDLLDIKKSVISEDYSRWRRNEEYRKEIVALLNKERKPMCIQEVANKIGCAWVTAKAILSDLSLEGKVKHYSNREGYGRLFMINEEWFNEKAAQKEV
jgi:hypothetical protein